MDNMLNMMDKYTNNLEEIVEERTEQLIEEKKKTDRLIYRMLPSWVTWSPLHDVIKSTKNANRITPDITSLCITIKH